MQFNLEAKHEVRAVNPRREMHGEERVIALDVKLVGYVPMAKLAPILGVESGKELEGSLWDLDVGDVALPNLSRIAVHSDTRFEQLTVHIAGIRLIECTARKFSGEPVAGGLEMTWLVTVPHPDSETISRLSEHIGETVKVVAESAQQSLDLGEGAEDGAAAETA